LWSALYLRSFLQDNSIDFVPSPGASYQDTAFNFKVWCAAGKVFFTKAAYYYYRQDNASSSVASQGKAMAIVGEFAAIEDYLRERPEKLAAFEQLATKLKFDGYLWNYERLAAELQLEFLEFAATQLQADSAAGKLNRSLFEPWKLYDLDLILVAPAKYHQLRTKYGGANKIGRIKFYLHSAGPIVCCKFIWSKLHRAA
jgi:hypothetical protein